MTTASTRRFPQARSANALWAAVHMRPRDLAGHRRVAATSMRTGTMSRTSKMSRRAGDTPMAHGLARAGLVARGVIYILIGWVAVLLALGHGSREADQQGALQLLADKPYGSLSLWLLGIGFAAYALWRLSEAAFGVAGDRNSAGPRLRSAARAVIYAGLAYLTFEVISGAHGSLSRRQQDITAKVMQHPGGRWLIGVAGDRKSTRLNSSHLVISYAV